MSEILPLSDIGSFISKFKNELIELGYVSSDDTSPDYHICDDFVKRVCLEQSQVFVALSKLTDDDSAALIADIRSLENIGDARKTIILSSKIMLKDLVKPVAKETVEFGAEQLAKKAGTKMAGKKIPVVGLVFGVAYGIYRFAEGDFSGASMELASGALSMIPGVGTALSAGMDLAIVAKDVVEARKRQKEVKKEEKQAVKDMRKGVRSLEEKKGYIKDNIDILRMIRQKVEDGFESDDSDGEDLMSKLRYLHGMAVRFVD